ncbi:hypothetical protein BF95_23755 [Sphingobium sp. Ant17]|nr:hypothetical protein BF95_23755 [Sphingobium sp. Ant17]
MKRFGTVLYLLALTDCGSLERQKRSYFMDKIEATAKLPKGWEGISNYHRYYAYSPSENGQKSVEAQFVLNERPGREWVEYEDLPIGIDAGCTVISVTFDVASDRVASALCNGTP